MKALLAMALIGGLSLLTVTSNVVGATTNIIYSTGFETSEGYDNASNAFLDGQNGWSVHGLTVDGTIVDGTAVAGFLQRFTGQGSQAYVGFFGPTDASETSFKLTRALNYDPLTNNTPIVKFSTYMEIVDSTTSNRDAFRWSVLNSQGHRFFSIDFDNRNQFICYVDEDPTNFVATAYSFTRDTPFTLEITMNFESNVWSAKVGLDTVITNAAITGTNSSAVLDIGQIVAEWDYIGDGAGDNALVFDNYTLSGVNETPNPPRVSLISMLSNGQPLLQVTGDAFRTHVLEYSTNFSTWMPLKTNTPSDGEFQHVDSGADSGYRFYRARVP